MDNDALRTYLNDHLGGATAALQLLGHLADSAETSEEKSFFQTLHAEITEDRGVLEQIIERTGRHPSSLRQVGGWMAAKLTELKLALDNPERGTLDRLQALEMLALGILGKRALWRALAALPQAPEVQPLDLPRLERRAEDQHAGVEARRVLAAKRALTAVPS